MRIFSRCCPIWMLFAASLAASQARAQDADALAWGRENIQAGKYTDAAGLLRKALAAQAEGSPVRRETALALIEDLRILGELKEARELCAKLLSAEPKDAALILLGAELDCETGEYERALKSYDAVIAAHPGNERAWALRTFVYRVFGDREGLKKTADHFFELYQNKQDYFNSDDVQDPLELAYVALGIQDEEPKTAFETGYALAEELSQKRGTRQPEILLWTARLALEKYSFSDAMKFYRQLAKLYPQLPDALAGQAAIVWQTQHNAETAGKLLADVLAVNPNHIDANLLQASIDLEEDRYEEAKRRVETALSVNPNHQEALAMQVFCYLDTMQPEKAREIEARVAARSPRCVDFYCAIGQLMESKRGFKAAPAYYQKAIDADPENWRGYYGLGMNLSRQGAATEERGKELLLKAFAKNKFNVWAKNMIVSLDKILGDKEQEVPPQYEVCQTEHFTIKFHAKDAAAVRPYLEEWAEQAYAAQTAKFGFKPEGPLTIELCSSFQDQAARTVGLPFLGALGVCFGKLCTVVSPREGRSKTQPPFNWRKVLEHEFAHVMVLQLSEFRVPRWYTEAFSTYIENDSRIETDPMMKDAIAKGRLKSADAMNEYFRVNPLMAYVHGRCVIEYIDKTFGFGAHIKAIQLFAKGKKLGEALREATGKELKELDEGQLAYVKNAYESVRMRPGFDPASLLQLELAAKPDDAPAQAVADYALAQMALRRFPQAEALAKRALAKDSKCADAINILGVLAFEKKDYEAAKQHFQESIAIDGQRSFEAWRRLGMIYKKEGRTSKAIEAFETARKIYPRYTGPDNPHYELPDLYGDLEPPQTGKALGVWRDAVKVNTHDAEAALKGLRLALKANDFKAAAEFAEAHIEVDPYNVEVHRSAGLAYERLKDWGRARREYGVATALEETEAESFVGLARVLRASGDASAARAAAEKALKIDAAHAEAQKLRDELKAAP